MRVYDEYQGEEKAPGLIRLDIDNLEFEARNLGLVFYDFRMYRAYARYQLSKAEAQLKRHRKELAAEVRLSPKDYGIGPPDLKTAIEEVVAANSTTIELENDVIEKQLVLDKIDAALEGLTQKSYGLSNAVKLLLRNYYADDPLTDKERRLLESFDYEEQYEKLAEVMRERREGGKE